MEPVSIKDILDISGFGLVAVIIIAAIRGGPRLIDLWTRGVVAMEKIADDMQEFRTTAVDQSHMIKMHSEQSVEHVHTIVGKIDGVHDSVRRVESKVDRIGGRA